MIRNFVITNLVIRNFVVRNFVPVPYSEGNGTGGKGRRGLPLQLFYLLRYI